MTDLHRTIFISDLHLQDTHPEITQHFLQLLQSFGSSIDALYILGDLFESWIGDDDDTPMIREVVNALKSVTQRGIPVYFLYGNRDFMVGKRFLDSTGCVLLSEETKISVYNRPVLVMHGDTLCTRDVVYLNARKKLRNPVLQKFFLWLPLFVRRKIANSMREKSKKHTSSVNSEVMDVTQNEVEKVMKKHDVTMLIHGHTHRPGMHEFNLDNVRFSRIVLGAWHGCGNMLVWDETGKTELKDC